MAFSLKGKTGRPPLQRQLFRFNEPYRRSHRDGGDRGYCWWWWRLMPALDRRIVLRRTVTARNQFGESVETTTDFPMWATRQDARQIDKAEAGGDVTLATRAYVIRYRAEIADALNFASFP